MKKYLGLVTVPFIVLTACGGGENNEESADAETSEVIGSEDEDATELSFWTFQELHIEIFETAVERWNDDNPDDQVTLVAEVYPMEQMHNNLRLALQSGEGAPDIVDVGLDEFPTFLTGDAQFESMNEHVEPILDDAVEARFDIYSQDGEYYGTPYHIGATVMYYNTEIMEEAGVDIDSIQTWEDYASAGQQVVENTDAMMTTLETEDTFQFWTMANQQGSDFFDENGELILDSDTNIEVMEFIQDMVYEDEIAQTAPGGAHHAEEYYGFMNGGGAASVMMPMWYMGRFIDYMPDLDDKIQIRPLPAWEEGGNRTAGMGGTGTVVTNQAENPELAKAFMAEAKLSEEANVLLWTELGFDPPRYSVWDDERIDEDNRFYQFFGDDIFDTLYELVDEVEAVNMTPYSNDVKAELTTNVLNEVLRQEMNPGESLENGAESVRTRMED